MLPGSFRSYFWMFLECEELSMGVISRGCWKGAFFLLGSWSFEALAFFCYVWNHFFNICFYECLEVAFHPFRWQTLFSAYGSVKQ